MELFPIFSWSALVIVCLVVPGKGITKTSNHRLVEELLNGYNTNVRPVLDENDHVVVNIELASLQIYNFDFRNQMISLNLWIRMFWTDELLTWDPLQHKNVSTVYFSSDLLWTPDVAIFNKAGESEAEIKSEQLEVKSNGQVRLGAPLRPTLSCQLEVTYFPWDEQKCSIDFGSLMRDKSTLDLFNKTDKLEMFTYQEHGEWEVIDTFAGREEFMFGCCPFPVPVVTYGLNMKRRPMYYLANLIMPCVIITLTALLAFCLPPDSGEKISLSVTVLLATTVFLLVVNESMPVQSLSTPYISLYFLSVMSLLVLSLVSTVIVLSVHHKGVQGRRPPKWLKYVLLKIIGPALMIFSPKDKDEKQEDKESMTVDPVMNNQPTLEGKDKMSSIRINDLERLSGSMHAVANHIKEKEEQEDICSEWEACARVLDRFFLVTYLIVLVVLSLIFLLRRP